MFMALKINKNHSLALMKFCHRLQNDQQKLIQSLNTGKEIVVYSESGRKFDKVIIDFDGKPDVRYFVRRADGSIFGAKSKFAPNLGWYFGTIYSADKWQWSGVHGVPVDDSSVRLVKSYGPYKHYMKIEE